MSYHSFARATATALALVVVACNPFHREPVTEVTRDVYANARWRASLVTPAALVGAIQINGAAIMQPNNKNGAATDLSLTIANATPGGVHPWQVHRGQCGTDDGLVGAASSYPSIKIGSDGRGSALATIAMTTPTTGSYFVTLLASNVNSETVLACGNLAPPTN